MSVFDDGRRVYVVFPRCIVQGEMPPVFVIGSDGEGVAAGALIRHDWGAASAQAQMRHATGRRSPSMLRLIPGP